MTSQRLKRIQFHLENEKMKCWAAIDFVFILSVDCVCIGSDKLIRESSLFS